MKRLCTLVLAFAFFFTACEKKSSNPVTPATTGASLLLVANSTGNSVSTVDLASDKVVRQALMLALDREKIIRDPSVRLVVEKLVPLGAFSYQGFTYRMRPIGNMLVKELGCGADLTTRTVLHGRMLRMIDVLCAMLSGSPFGPIRQVQEWW